MLLVFSSLSKRFNKKKSIQFIYSKGSGEICINRGEFVFITGANGIGKSTLIHMLATLDKGEYSKDASVRFYEYRNGRATEHDYWKLFRIRFISCSLCDPTALLRRRCFGFLPQEGHLIDSYSVKENLVIRQLLCGSKTKVGIDTLDPGLRENFKDSPSALSGGKRQKLALQRAVIGKPSIIFADEPTSSLDRDSFNGTLIELARLIKEQEITVLMVTHRYEESLEVLEVVRENNFPSLPLRKLNLQPVEGGSVLIKRVNLEYEVV